MATRAQRGTMPDVQLPEALSPAPGQRITVSPWHELGSNIEAWDALAAHASEPNPFFEAWYLLPSLRAFGAESSAEIIRFEQDGRLCGLLPIASQSRYYQWPLPNITSWLHANCFLGTPLVEKGCEVAFWQALLRWTDDNAGMALFLHLRELPLDGPLYAALRGVLEAESRHWQCVHKEQRAMLASSSDPETYWNESLSGKKRKELRRQARRLAEEGAVEFSRATDDQGIDDWIAQFLALEAAGWKGREGSALACDPATTALFCESLTGAAARGKLERLTLSFNDEPIAMLATFLTPPGAYSYKTTFDETFSRYSPGVLLQQENLAFLDRDDIAWTDSCASADHPMIDHIWRERRAVGRFSIAIGGRLRRLAFRGLARFETAHDPIGDAQ